MWVLEHFYGFISKGSILNSILDLNIKKYWVDFYSQVNEV